MTIEKIKKWWTPATLQIVRVKVSDISEALNLPCPEVTRAVKEMERKGYLKKVASEEEGRVTYISATKAPTVM